MKSLIHNQSNQHGMAIIMALVFLLVLTVLGITATNTTILTEKMSQNMRDMTSAFQAGESALGDGEGWLENQTAVPSTCSAAPCNVWMVNTPGSSYQQPTSWWQTNGRAFSTTIPGLAVQPRYIIEQYSFVPYDLSPNTLATGKGYFYYRVTARGIGGTTNAIANVQSIYVMRYN